MAEDEDLVIPVNDEGEPEPWELLAGALGSLSEIEDDEEGLDYQEVLPEEEGEFEKIPLEQAGNLIRLRKLVAAMSANEISTADFSARLQKFWKPLEDGLDLLDTDAVKAQVETMSDLEAPIFQHTQDQLAKLLEGLGILAEYPETMNPEDLEEGMDIVEEAMQSLDQIQDQAIELDQEQELRQQAEQT